ncbi:hypothetical protein OAF54_02970 [bacterium]|nr:hypothetical protein [bacterium]
MMEKETLAVIVCMVVAFAIGYLIFRKEIHEWVTSLWPEPKPKNSFQEHINCRCSLVSIDDISDKGCPENWALQQRVNELECNAHGHVFDERTIEIHNYYTVPIAQGWYHTTMSKDLKKGHYATTIKCTRCGATEDRYFTKTTKHKEMEPAKPKAKAKKKGAKK